MITSQMDSGLIMQGYLNGIADTPSYPDRFYSSSGKLFKNMSTCSNNRYFEHPDNLLDSNRNSYDFYNNRLNGDTGGYCTPAEQPEAPFQNFYSLQQPQIPYEISSTTKDLKKEKFIDSGTLKSRVKNCFSMEDSSAWDSTLNQMTENLTIFEGYGGGGSEVFYIIICLSTYTIILNFMLDLSPTYSILEGRYNADFEFF